MLQPALPLGVLRVFQPEDAKAKVPELPTNSDTMTNSERIQLAADQKRSEAKRKLSQMFRIPDGYSSPAIDELVDDIISAAILEISAIQAKASESNDQTEQRHA